MKCIDVLPQLIFGGFSLLNNSDNFNIIVIMIYYLIILEYFSSYFALLFALLNMYMLNIPMALHFTIDLFPHGTQILLL